MGQLFVTLPAKPGKSGRYFDYLRPAKPDNGTVKAVQAFWRPVGGSA